MQYLKGKNIGHDDLGFPVSGEIIRIVPVIIGSKRQEFSKQSLVQLLLRQVLPMVFSQRIGLMAYGIQAGGAMMLGGVVQMLSPQPAGLARKESADNKASYAFGGVTNTASQGYPVPLLYGKRRIGGAIISAGIYVEDQQ
jgi:predicted phage tail protein